MLRGKSELFRPEQNELFGPKFQQDWYATMKVTQKHADMLKQEQKAKHPQPIQFFRGGPSHRGRGGGGRRMLQVRRNTFNQQGPNYQNCKSPFNLFSRAGPGGFEKCESSNSQIVSRFHSPNSPSWQNKTFCTELGKINSGPKHPPNSDRIQNSLSVTSLSKGDTSLPKVKSTRPPVSVTGGTGNARKRSDKENDTCKGSVFEQYFPCSEKGRGKQTGDQSKTIERVHSLSPFQNGEHASFEGYFAAERLHAQDRPEGCLLFNTHWGKNSGSLCALFGRGTSTNFFACALV